MKNGKTLLTAALVSTVALCSLDAYAREKKNDPDKREVEKELKEIGGEHYVEKMKISHLCSLKFEKPDGEDSYYHIYSANLKKEGFRVIIYDNTPTYLGYYKSEFEPYDYEEGYVWLESGESDEDGNDRPYKLPIPDKGPAKKVRIGDVQSSFVANPKLAAEGQTASTGPTKLVVPKEKSSTGVVIDYRDWTITMGGKKLTVKAIFVEKVGSSNIKIKDSKRGKTATIKISAISDADRAYLKSIGEL